MPSPFLLILSFSALFAYALLFILSIIPSVSCDPSDSVPSLNVSGSDFGDRSDPRLYLNDQYDIVDMAQKTSYKSVEEDLVRANRNSEDYHSTIYIPFSSLADYEDHVLNRIPRNWWFEMLTTSRIVFVILDNSMVDNKHGLRKAELSPKVKIEDFIGFQTKRVAVNPCYIRDMFRMQSTWAKTLLTMFFCVDQKRDEPFAVISPTMYADPYDLQSILDSFVNDPPSNLILPMENEAIISTNHIWTSWLNMFQNHIGTREIPEVLSSKLNAGQGLLKFFDDYQLNDFVVSPLKQALELGLLKPIRKLDKVFGDYSMYPSSKKMMDRNQELRARVNIESCSRPPQRDYSFHETFTASFKGCSFVANLNRDYEFHAVRYLQRLARGKRHEVNWADTQIDDNNNKRCDIAVIVTSRTTYIHERMLIRKLWGPWLRSMGTVKLFFMYGHPATHIPEKTQRQLELERQYFKDVVVLPVTEGYFLMFQKVTASFGWVVENTNCEVVMKMDPDTYPRIFPIMKTLFQRNVLPVTKTQFSDGLPDNGVYLGFGFYNAKIIKDPNNRWYFYDKWPHDILPVFMSGALFGMTKNLAKYVYEHREPDMRLDDPGIGAILSLLKKERDSAVTYSSPVNFDMYPPDGRCKQDRYMDNSVFTKNFNVSIHLMEDLFGTSFCNYLKKHWVPLNELVKNDDLYIFERTKERSQDMKIINNTKSIKERRPGVKLIIKKKEKDDEKNIGKKQEIIEIRHHITEIKVSSPIKNFVIAFLVPWISLFMVVLLVTIKRRRSQNL